MSESSFRSGNIIAAYTYLYNAVEEDKLYYGYIFERYADKKNLHELRFDQFSKQFR